MGEVLLFSRLYWGGHRRNNQEMKQQTNKPRLRSGLGVWADVLEERFMETSRETEEVKLETYEKTRF